MSTNKCTRVFLVLCVFASMTATVVSAAGSSQAKYSKPLPVEAIPNVESLPASYPDTWIFAQDLNFNSLLDGKIAIIDVAAKNRNYKGMISAGMVGNFKASSKRPELYATMTVYSRLTYGERTDVLVVYDKKTLQPIDEVILPAKRQQIVPQLNSFQFLGDDERIGLVMNFTPATSVSIVDLVERKFLGEVATPGCNFIFPTGKNAFSSLCADGAMVTYTLNSDGSVKDTQRSKQFIDIAEDPIFIKNSEVDGIHYFPSFQGRMQPIDFRGSAPKILDDWSFIPDSLKAENWRPSGWHIVGASSSELFVIMQPDGKEGSHKEGGTEVWVLNPKTKKMVRRIRLPKGGLSLTLTHSKPALLVVTNGEMELDVMDSQSGALQRTINVNISAFPFVLQAN